MSSHTQQISKCKISAAMHDEIDKGWIWLLLDEGFSSRMTIKISHGEKSIHCEYRKIDANFVKVYHRDKECGNSKIELDPQYVVISDWYRKALGIKGTTHELPSQEIALTITRPSWRWLADLMAGCQHPEPGARVATQIAIWGIWLGFAGLFPVLLDHGQIKTWLECHNVSFFCAWAPATIILFIGCWCISRRDSSS
jgi:hypothetical protein